MPSDPTLAARIDEALHTYECDEQPEGHPMAEHMPWDEPVEGPTRGEAILAALSGYTLVSDAELERLRRIEAAARDIADRSPIDTDGERLDTWCHYCESFDDRKHQPGCDWVALTAALTRSAEVGPSVTSESSNAK